MTKKKTDYHNHPTSRIFGGAWSPKAGEVGIEVEVEGRHLPMELPKASWVTHRDGSLRGESIEYVLGKPVLREKVEEVLAELDGYLKADKATKINESYRTSVHIHLNMQKQTVKEVYNVVCLYVILEDILVEYAGASRVGNLFCLRAQDAEFLVTQLRQAIRSGQFNVLAADNLRYSGINVTALYKYGSLEFRSLRGTVDPKLINTWTSMLLQIKDAALKFENPQEILGRVSQVGADEFLGEIFNGETLREFRSVASIPKRIIEGARLIQDVAFACDWAKPDPKTKEEEEQLKKKQFYQAPPVHWDGNAFFGDPPAHARRDPIHWPQVHGRDYDSWPLLDTIVRDPEHNRVVGRVLNHMGQLYIFADGQDWVQIKNPVTGVNMTMQMCIQFWENGVNPVEEDDIDDIEEFRNEEGNLVYEDDNFLDED